jgi:putative hydrolase of the HAD superfamily
MKKSAVFFDLDNTLFDYEASFKKASLFAFSSVISPQLMKPVNPNDWFVHYKKYCDLYWSEYENKSLTQDQYRKKRLEASILTAKIPLTIDTVQLKQFQMAFEKNIPNSIAPYPWIPKIVNSIDPNWSIAGVISNGASDLQRKKLRQLGLNFLEKNIFISSEINLEKPDPQIFHYVAKHVKAESLIYCGDSFEFDIQPAVLAGWTGIWWNPLRKSLPSHLEKMFVCSTDNDLVDTIMKCIE